VKSSVVPCPSCGRRNRVPAAATGTPRCARCRAPLPWITDADDSDFDLVASGRLPVLVDLWAQWCGPCRAVSPALEQLARDHAGEVKLVKVDVDRAPEVSQRFGVQAVPTLVVLREGAEVARQIGAAPEPALRRWLEGALASTAAPS
jgi:thioredoxin 2